MVGVGKTAYMYGLGRRFGRHVEAVMASLRQPSDYAGLPTLQPWRRGRRYGARRRDAGRKAVVFAPPIWARRLQEHGGGILLHDEFTTARPATAAAMLRGLHEGIYGDAKLTNVWTVCAYNPARYATNGFEMTAAVSNRGFHLVWDFPASAWRAAARQGFPPPEAVVLPADWRGHLPDARELVLFFLEQPEFDRWTDTMPRNQVEAEQAFPTRRTWELTWEALAACKALGHAPTSDLASQLVTAAIGAPAAIEFLAYVSNLDLPDPEQALANPQGFVLPPRADRQYMALAMLAGAVERQPTRTRWEAGMHCCGLVAQKGAADVTMAAVLRLLAVMPMGAQFPASVPALVKLLREAGVTLDKDRRPVVVAA
jgi:hypothetical protein